MPRNRVLVLLDRVPRWAFGVLFVVLAVGVALAASGGRKSGSGSAAGGPASVQRLDRPREARVSVAVAGASGAIRTSGGADLKLTAKPKRTVVLTVPERLSVSSDSVVRLRLTHAVREAAIALHTGTGGDGRRVEVGPTILSTTLVPNGVTLLDVTAAFRRGARRFVLTRRRASPSTITIGGRGSGAPVLLASRPVDRPWDLTGPDPGSDPLTSVRGAPNSQVTLDQAGARTARTPAFTGRAAAGGAGPVRLAIWRGSRATGNPMAVAPAIVRAGRWRALRPLPRGTWTVRAEQTARRGGRREISRASTFEITADPQLAAAGDIACDPASPSFNGGDGVARAQQCRMRAVSDRILRSAPSAVLALGDIQYVEGQPSKYLRSWDPTWGRLESIMRPVVGNHEVFPLPGIQPGDSYWDHFNGRGRDGGIAGTRGEGWYSFQVGWWHVIVLSSNCFLAICDATSPQGRWLAADLARSRSRCTIAAYHEPLVGIGTEPDNTKMRPLFAMLQKAGVELVLNGHQHDYERWAPITADGRRDDVKGLRHLVVGTGGVGLNATVRQDNRVEVRSQIDDGRRWEGFLDLRLRQGTYDWRFVTETGAVNDRGSGAGR